MCGVFGFVGTSVDLALLDTLGRRASARGPHSWGVAWYGPQGGMFKEPVSYERATRKLTAIAGLGSAKAIVGHCRLSTSGVATVNENNQPLRFDGTAIAHNGNIYDHRHLAGWYGAELVTECDSELALRLIGELSDVEVLRTLGVMGTTAYALLAAKDGRYLAARRGQPLYRLETAAGVYFCSMPFAGATLIEDETYEVMTMDNVTNQPTHLGEDGKPTTQFAATRQATPTRQHPLANIRWVDPSTLRANGYNPNHVFSPEFELLKISILEDGWTQPVVVRENGEIVDGFHRWTLASTDPEIKAISGGLVPVVMLPNKSEAEQMMATIRHNRARGKHGILRMADIVRAIASSGLDEADVQRRLGMDREEFQRLTDLRGSPESKSKDSFGKGWVPVAAVQSKAAKDAAKKRQTKKNEG